MAAKARLHMQERKNAVDFPPRNAIKVCPAKIRVRFSPPDPTQRIESSQPTHSMSSSSNPNKVTVIGLLVFGVVKSPANREG
ncbi:Hypothetical predicted protein [Olea europaea subsp. europaea]|uniref:Uncharacterized protein n=1 Tax=Olea europaea subsp. europaea TaxID=158383 RepID=A0A8S0QUR2_OLEEU|nr:Hypothetical predicted protein [Olea europaea subsp. europaea]